MRGRKPVPTALRAVRGNPGKRPLPQGEPTPEIASGYCPKYLTGDLARKLWAKWAPALVRLRVLSELDEAALACACLATAEALQDPTAKKLAAAARAQAECGLTPSSRTRIQTVPVGQRDALEELLGGREGAA